MPFLTKTGGGGNRRDQDQDHDQHSAAVSADCRRGVVACVVADWLVAAAGRAVGWLAGWIAVPVLGAPADGSSRPQVACTCDVWP